MSPRKSSSSALQTAPHQCTEKTQRFGRVGVYPHDPRVPYHAAAKQKRSRRKANKSCASTPFAVYANVSSSENEELQRLIPLKLSLDVDCSPAERPPYRSFFLNQKFSWPEAFSKAGDTMMVIFDALPLMSLAKLPLVSKEFNRMVRGSPVLSRKLCTPGAEYFVELYALDNRLLRAPEPASDSPFRKTLQGSYRKILIDWLVDVQSEYNLSSETLHQATVLVDRCFAAKPDLPTNKIQLLGATCLFIAAKFTDVEPPTLQDMVWVCDNCYSREEHMQMETLALGLLDFRLRCLTPAEYIRAFCSAFGFADDTRLLALYCADLYLLEGLSLGDSPLLTAAAALALALHTQAIPVPMDRIALLAKTSQHAVRAVACRMQSLRLLDFNGQTAPDARQQLRACKERYASVRCLHVCTRFPPRDPEVRVGQAGQCGQVQCAWCGGEGCARELMSKWRCAFTNAAPGHCAAC